MKTDLTQARASVMWLWDKYIVKGCRITAGLWEIEEYWARTELVRVEEFMTGHVELLAVHSSRGTEVELWVQIVAC